MAGLQASSGLVTGIPIQDTVDQLIALQALPRDRLVARQKVLQAEQAAVADLTALTLGVQFAIRRLKNLDLFTARKATSSLPSLLSATASPSAAPGQYPFVPVRAAGSQQALSSGVAATDAALGGGTFTVRYGGQVDRGVSLADLNGGAGVSRGKLKITDRDGVSAVIDLRYAQTIDDVIAAINASDDVGVRASAVGDRLVLTDSTLGAGNLRVQEIAGGTTAADLGLANINVAANEASGASLVQLFDGLGLNQLRDGAGFSLRPELSDLEITLHDGSTLSIDLDPADEPDPKTLGNLLERINSADPAKLAARISADGLRIELEDLTAGNGTFAVSNPAGGSLAEELGLTGSESGGVITGSRLISGLKTTLLSSLAGGAGLGSLGTLELTDRSGQAASVNLSAAQTLDDVIATINAASVGITASYNAARNGVLLRDTTGSSANNLVVANGDATNTATKLGLVADVAALSVNSGSLARQVVSRNTLLSSYNGGRGVRSGTVVLTDSAGNIGSINLSQATTIGDVIDKINALSIGVEARINDAGDGIAIIDSAGGSGTLTVADSGASQAAADLHIAGSGQAASIDNQPVQILDGSTTFSVELAADETLEDLAEKLNELGEGFTASLFDDGAGSLRHHLSLVSGIVGAAGELLIDGSDLGLGFQDISKAQDALLQIGGSGAAGILVSSPSSNFDDVQPGLDVNLLAASTETVTVSVAQTSESVASALQLFVDQYNKLRDKLDTYTAFNSDAGTKGTLFGSSETLRLDSELSNLITGRHFGDSAIRSLAELGVSIDEQGELTLDRTKLDAKFAADPEAVSEFFADEERGFAVKADAILERIVGRDRSLLINRTEVLQRKIEDFGERIETWGERLTRSRERLLLEFFNLEQVVARIQNNLTALSQLQVIKPIEST